MLKIGTPVKYRDRANRLRTGKIDGASDESGCDLFRIRNRWFPKEALERVRWIDTVEPSIR